MYSKQEPYLYRMNKISFDKDSKTDISQEKTSINSFFSNQYDTENRNRYYVPLQIKLIDETPTLVLKRELLDSETDFCKMMSLHSEESMFESLISQTNDNKEKKLCFPKWFKIEELFSCYKLAAACFELNIMVSFVICMANTTLFNNTLNEKISDENRKVASLISTLDKTFRNMKELKVHLDVEVMLESILKEIKQKRKYSIEPTLTLENAKEIWAKHFEPYFKERVSINEFINCIVKFELSIVNTLIGQIFQKIIKNLQILVHNKNIEDLLEDENEKIFKKKKQKKRESDTAKLAKLKVVKGPSDLAILTNIQNKHLALINRRNKHRMSNTVVTDLMREVVDKACEVLEVHLILKEEANEKQKKEEEEKSNKVKIICVSKFIKQGKLELLTKVDSYSFEDETEVHSHDSRQSKKKVSDKSMFSNEFNDFKDNFMNKSVFVNKQNHPNRTPSRITDDSNNSSYSQSPYGNPYKHFEFNPVDRLSLDIQNYVSNVIMFNNVMYPFRSTSIFNLIKILQKTLGLFIIRRLPFRTIRFICHRLKCGEQRY